MPPLLEASRRTYLRCACYPACLPWRWRVNIFISLDNGAEAGAMLDICAERLYSGSGWHAAMCDTFFVPKSHYFV